MPWKDPSFWKFVGLLALVFSGMLGIIVWAVRSGESFVTWQRLQAVYPLTSELKAKLRLRWIGIPLCTIGNASFRWMLSECTVHTHYLLRPSIFLRIAGMRAIAVPHSRVSRRAGAQGLRIRLPKGKSVSLVYGSLFGGV